MTVAVHAFIFCIFATWLILTVLNQFDIPSGRFLRRHDVFFLLPRWTFFAPNPGTFDYHLVYRYVQNDGTISDFREVILSKRHPFLAAVWNPQKRLSKALLDVAIDVSRLCSIDSIDEQNVKITFSYLALLNCLRRVHLPSGVQAVQFALVRSSGFIDIEAPHLVICSDFHTF